MKLYELVQLEQELEQKSKVYIASLEAAENTAREYYKHRVCPAENDCGIDDDEMTAIYDMYDELCDARVRVEEHTYALNESLKAIKEAIWQLTNINNMGLWQGD